MSFFLSAAEASSISQIFKDKSHRQLIGHAVILRGTGMDALLLKMPLPIHFLLLFPSFP
jgi:hypothetical protein